MEEIDMDESDLSQVSLSVEGITDEFSEIKSHYENGIALTDSIRRFCILSIFSPFLVSMNVRLMSTMETRENSSLILRVGI